MKIRKRFKFEGAHIVRNCSSKRCAFSIHGHSYLVDLFLSAQGLDHGGMILDFGILKREIGDFIDSFDHATTVWSKDEKIVEATKALSERYVVLPVSPSAENYALMFLFVIDTFLKATRFTNGERRPFLTGVRVHETATGYAEAERTDLDWIDYRLEDITFSPAVISEWQDPRMYEKLLKFRSGKVSYAFSQERPDHHIH